MIISDVTKLKKRSNELINVQCDDCFEYFEIKYVNYHRNGNKGGLYTCKACKTKKTNLEKWGVENTSQLSEVKEKKKQTLKKNFGVDHPSKSDIIKEKKRIVFQEKFGVDNPFQNEEIKEKIKRTNLDKFGVDNPSKHVKFKEKKRQTLLENWGVNHPLKSREIKEKVIRTNLERWRVEWGLQNEEVKEKIKRTNLYRFGFDNPMKSNVIREKVVQNNLEKWGVKYFYQTDEFRKLSNISKLGKWGNNSYKKSDYFYSTTIIGNDKDYIRYLDNSEHLFKCDCGKEFIIRTDNYFSRKKSNIKLCTICNPIGDLKSIKEKELYEFIKSIHIGEIIQSWRDGLEIDVYLPELNLGFEFNGLYYHSDKYKDKWYHLNKTKYFNERGIRIIHIWEDDWDNRRSILESQIKNWLGLTPNRVFARRCKVVNLDSVSDFLNNNHIQGSDYSKVKIGLSFGGEIVSVMTFNKLEGRNIMKDGEWNLSRFCNKKEFNVIGSASKLLKYFQKKYKVSRVISYSDRDWSFGGLYENLGFSKVSEGRPDYKYIINGIRIHKSRFKKSKTGISENNLEIQKVWDCGKVKFEKLLCS